jgi:3-hydroxybutyryl-CoA dehydratase
MQGDFSIRAIGLRFEDLQLGAEASLTRRVTLEDIERFAEVSGDFNPVHLDESFAAGTMFKKRIAHGTLIASYISAVFGMKLPGPGAIYVSQTLNFRAPVYIGDDVIAKVRITDLIEAKKRALFHCECTVRDKLVLEGEAVLLVPSRAGKP